MSADLRRSGFSGSSWVAPGKISASREADWAGQILRSRKSSMSWLQNFYKYMYNKYKKKIITACPIFKENQLTVNAPVFAR